MTSRRRHPARAVWRRNDDRRGQGTIEFDEDKPVAEQLAGGKLRFSLRGETLFERVGDAGAQRLWLRANRCFGATRYARGKNFNGGS
jgi:hypothetical protein